MYDILFIQFFSKNHVELIQIDPKQDNDATKKLSKPKIDLTTNQVSDIKIWLVDPTYTQQQNFKITKTTRKNPKPCFNVIFFSCFRRI